MRVEQALTRWVAHSEPDAPAAALSGAMRYAVLEGGKRLRPLLVLAASEAVAGSPQAALRAACAVELIHAYSLVHDDMPCMDNDVLRRGKPTVHVQFGEAGALLAGDALQALAFEMLTPQGEPAGAVDEVDPATQARLCGLLARAAGLSGMAGGQAIDLASVGSPLDSATLHEMHRRKTGALLQASVMMGVACGALPAASRCSVEAALSDYGWAIGLAFQVMDDVLDVTADSLTLGKTPGKDAAHDKPTFVSLMGLSGSQAYALHLLDRALAQLEKVHAAGYRQTAALQGLAHLLVERVR
ncbi:MAG: polyprenyl synthetase family protein [Polaromonas sp.]|nr:polyprenyl synthetase family protein [Polaromonas sp.]